MERYLGRRFGGEPQGLLRYLPQRSDRGLRGEGMIAITRLRPLLWILLAEEERHVTVPPFRFAGGFNLEAAEAICTGDRVGLHAVLDLLKNLADKRIVVAERLNGDIRYLLLQTIRQYGLERL